MNQEAYIAKLENENHRLKAQLMQFSALTTDTNEITAVPSDIKLFLELDHLENLGTNFPNGCLIRIQIETDKLKNTETWYEHLHLIYASPWWEQISHVPRIEALHNLLPSLKRIVEDDFVEMVHTVHKSLLECTLFNKEFRFQSSVGERWLQLALQPRIADRWTVCEGFILDINERKKIEIELAEYRINLEHLVKERTEELDTAIEELRATNEQMESKNNELYREMEACTNAVKLLEESEAKMRNFIDQSLEGILIFDNNGCVIEWNPSMEDITGLKKENAIGKLEWELRLKMYPEDQRTQQELDNLRKKRLAYMNDENSQKTVEDVSFHFADGSVTYARVSLFPIKVSDTKRYFGRIVRDISRQHLADMELQQYRSSLEEMVKTKTKELTIAKEKAEESDRLKSAFLANMSHEVRTPLNGIVGLLNILAADPEVPENIREYIDIINKNSEILQRLINDILDAAKLESGLMAIIPEPVYIDNLIDEMFIIFQHQLQTSEKAHIELETVKDANADNCSVYADPVRLRQIIHNLLSNAVKFTDSGYIRFGYSVHKPDSIEFFVEDTGAGISATQTGHIFERFRQAEGGRRAGGTGLGLTISRNLAQLMGGDMTVESVEGKGSIFTFSIAYKPVTTN